MIQEKSKKMKDEYPEIVKRRPEYYGKLEKGL
jgi:hypothetical protein